MKVAESPAFLEACANHPRVRPYIGPFLGGHPEKWPECVGLEWDEGGIVFERVKEGVYAAHFIFLPDTPDVVGKSRQALRYMFTRTGANRIIGKTPVAFRHARKAAKAAGMRHLFTCAGFSHCELTRAEWIKHKE